MKTAGQIGSRLGNRGKQPFDGVPQGNGPNIRQRVEPHIGNTWKAQSADFGPGNNAGAAVGQGIRERLQPNMGQTWRQSDGVSMSQQEIEALAARLGKQIQEITDQDIMAAKAGQI